MKRQICWMMSGLMGIVLIFSAGCMGLGGGVAASTTPLEGREYIILDNVVSTDSCVMFLGFIPVSDLNSVHDAVKDGLRKNNADALINVTVDTYTAYFILFSRTYTRVTGTAIRFVPGKR
jgi:hypothetical protein